MFAVGKIDTQVRGSTFFTTTNENILFVGSSDGNIHSTRLQKTTKDGFFQLSSEITCREVGEEAIDCLLLSPDECSMVALSSNNRLHLFSIAGEVLTDISSRKFPDEMHYTNRSTAHCWANNKVCLFGCLDGSLLAYDYTSDTLRPILKEETPIIQVARSEDGTFLAVSCVQRSCTVSIMALSETIQSDEQLECTQVGVKPRDEGLYGACFFDNRVYAARHNTRVFEADPETGTVYKTYRLPEGVELGFLTACPALSTDEVLLLSETPTVISVLGLSSSCKCHTELDVADSIVLCTQLFRNFFISLTSHDELCIVKIYEENCDDNSDDGLQEDESRVQSLEAEPSLALPDAELSNSTSERNLVDDEGNPVVIPKKKGNVKKIVKKVKKRILRTPRVQTSAEFPEKQTEILPAEPSPGIGLRDENQHETEIKDSQCSDHAENHKEKSYTDNVLTDEYEQRCALNESTEPSSLVEFEALDANNRNSSVCSAPVNQEEVKEGPPELIDLPENEEIADEPMVDNNERTDFSPTSSVEEDITTKDEDITMQCEIQLQENSVNEEREIETEQPTCSGFTVDSPTSDGVLETPSQAFSQRLESITQSFSACRLDVTAQSDLYDSVLQLATDFLRFEPPLKVEMADFSILLATSCRWTLEMQQEGVSEDFDTLFDCLTMFAPLPDALTELEMVSKLLLKRSNIELYLRILSFIVHQESPNAFPLLSGNILQWSATKPFADLEESILFLDNNVLEKLELGPRPEVFTCYYLPFLFATVPKKAQQVCSEKFPISIRYISWCLSSQVQSKAADVVNKCGGRLERLNASELQNFLTETVLSLCEDFSEQISKSSLTLEDCFQVLLAHRAKMLGDRQHAHERKVKKIEDQVSNILSMARVKLSMKNEKVRKIFEQYQYPEGIFAIQAVPDTISDSVRQDRIDMLLPIFQRKDLVTESHWISLFSVAHELNRLEQAITLCLTVLTKPKVVRYFLRRAFPFVDSPDLIDEQLTAVTEKLSNLIIN